MRAFFLLSNIQVAHFRLGLGPQGNDVPRQDIYQFKAVGRGARGHAWAEESTKVDVADFRDGER